MLFCFCFLGYRTADIGSRIQTAGSSAQGIRLDIAELRGTVYDCNMKPLTNAQTVYCAVAKPTLRAMSALESELDAVVFSSVRERLASGEPVAVSVKDESVSGEDITVVPYPERYDGLACHVIGYLGYDGGGVSGIEKSFDDLLSQNGFDLYARVGANADGRVLFGEEPEIVNNAFPSAGVVLTIDRDIQKIVEDALDSSGAECAAAVVMDVGTGAVRACASRPSFDPENISDVLNDENSPLLNRAFQAFSVGSVFKPVVAASALEKGIGTDYSYDCTGCITLNGVTFNCHKKDGHGVLNMEEALAHSCNTYFISLALEVGGDGVIEMAEKFGFGEQTVFAESLKARSGNLPEKVDSKAATANLSFGQGELTATPVQICSMMATVANGGRYVKPYLVEGETDENGSLTRISRYSEKIRIISAETARIIRSFLVSVVERGSGSRARSDFVACAGKTATAQTGKSENGEEIYNAWFAGYFPADEPQYAVVILRENGGEGAVSCAPVFKEIAEKTAELRE